MWQFLLHLFSLPQQSGAWEPTSLICVPVHAQLLLVCSCRSGRVRQHYYMFISSENVYAWPDMCCFTSVLLLYVIIGPYRTSAGGNQQKCMCVCTTGDTSGRDRAEERCFTMYQLYHYYVNLGTYLPDNKGLTLPRWATYDAQIYRFLQLIHFLLLLNQYESDNNQTSVRKSHGS